MEPEKRLWTAVLVQAVRDAARLLKNVQENQDLWGDPLFRSEVRDLKQYFRNQSMAPGRFGFVCDVVGVDPKKVARCVEEKYFQHLVLVNKHSTQMATPAAT
ncbi:MAG: hypothetical protein H7839_20485 [Magnetococcus sp. YQC-5]